MPDAKATPGGAVLVCRSDATFNAVFFTNYADLDAALAAAKNRCRPTCVHDHDVAHVDDSGHVRVQRIPPPAPADVGPTLRAALDGDDQALQQLRQDLDYADGAQHD